MKIGAALVRFVAVFWLIFKIFGSQDAAVKATGRYQHRILKFKQGTACKMFRVI